MLHVPLGRAANAEATDEDVELRYLLPIRDQLTTDMAIQVGAHVAAGDLGNSAQGAQELSRLVLFTSEAHETEIRDADVRLHLLFGVQGAESNSDDLRGWRRKHGATVAACASPMRVDPSV